MKRVLLLALLLLALFSGGQLASMASEMQCHVECTTCATTCEKTLAYCSKQSKKHTEAEHINALKDCISACKQSADFMTRDSSLNKEACTLCEQACIRCAESCEAMKGDKTMQACAEECRKCAKSCHEMAAA
jgi:hypothetical protein